MRMTRTVLFMIFVCPLPGLDSLFLSGWGTVRILYNELSGRNACDSHGRRGGGRTLQGTVPVPFHGDLAESELCSYFHDRPRVCDLKK